MPDATRKKLPRYGQIPAVLLGRLAVAKEMQNRGLGGLLLVDAVKRADRSGIAWALLVVQAKHDGAAAFYRHFGLVPFAGDPLRLWIRAALAVRMRLPQLNDADYKTLDKSHPTCINKL